MSDEAYGFFLAIGECHQRLKQHVKELQELADVSRVIHSTDMPKVKHGFRFKEQVSADLGSDDSVGWRLVVSLTKQKITVNGDTRQFKDSGIDVLLKVVEHYSTTAEFSTKILGIVNRLCLANPLTEMTEAEWLASAKPQTMLNFLRRSASERKLRLFACACCRRILHLSAATHLSRREIEFAERFADGQASETELCGRAWGKSGEGFPCVNRDSWRAATDSAAYGAAKAEGAVHAADEEMYKTWQNAFDAAWGPQNTLYEAKEIADAGLPAELVAAIKSACSKERQSQASILRDVFANPFRPAIVDPFWLTPNVTHIAQAIYDGSAFDGLSTLADTLEEAGCTNEDILRHCRGPGPHVRGCWVVDLLLGRGS